MFRFSLLFLSATAFSADFKFYEPKEGGDVALNLFQVPEGMELTLWARSPVLANPTNFDIDAQGRVWVTEGVNYRQYNVGGKRRPEGDRVVVLSDTKGAGRADTAQTFIQDANWSSPLGIAVFDNVIIVSHAPDLIKFTDVNRDGKFDPAIDKREILLTGFGGQDHDHSLHAVVAGPDGKLYLNAGNCGGVFTDKSGKNFNIVSNYDDQRGAKWPFDRAKAQGQKSDDGFVWISGFSARMNDDGSNVEVIGNGYRNSFEHFPTSFGDLFQGDNDDSMSCRTSYVLEYASAGFTTPTGQSFRSVRRGPAQPFSRAHWRQDDPDTFDVGDIYGSGSPSGMVVYENGALDEQWNGTLLSCESSRNTILAYKIQPQKAGFKLDAESRLEWVTSNAEKEYYGVDFNKPKKDTTAKEKVLFRPSDICVGPDGAIYIADWYDARVGGHQTLDDQCSGSIYRLAPKGFKSVIPKIDLTTPEGAVAALRNPAMNVRHQAFKAIQSFGEKSLPAIKELLNDKNSFVAARAIWLLPYLGDEGVKNCEGLLKDTNPQNRITAYRALRRAGIDVLGYAKVLANDSNSAVRRDVATSLHGVSADKALPILITLAAKIDHTDKNSLTAFGVGSFGKQEEVWAAIKTDAKAWSPQIERLAWVLHPASAVQDCVSRVRSTELSKEQKLLALETLSFIDSKEAGLAMIQLCSSESELKNEATRWVLMRISGLWAAYDLRTELKKSGVYDPEKIVVNAIVSMEPPRPTYTEQDVLNKKGDPEKGGQLIMRCTMCHQINGAGVALGPELRGWGTRQGVQAVVRSIVNPSADIAHGYDGFTIKLKNGVQVDGIMQGEGDPLSVLSVGGVSQLIPKSFISQRVNKEGKPDGLEINKMNRSLMMSAEQLGLTAQEVADIAAWMATYR
jgi:putative membrane-bound dehydrogenase-like protein